MEVNDIDDSEYVEYQGFGFSFDSLKAEEIQLGGKSWRIKKLLPIEGKGVLLRYIRPCFSAFQGVDFYEKVGNEGEVVNRPQPAIFMELIAKIPTDKLEAMSAIFMKKSIEYRDENGMWVPAAYDSGKAFMNLEPAELVLLDAMAFYQNFSKSVSVIAQYFRGTPAPQAGTDQS